MEYPISPIAPGPFKPDLENLAVGYKAADWFRDAKFGIYIHWGVYSVAEMGEWYGRRMYIPGSPENLHHIKTWGHPSKFGYKDFIPLWKAEKFDPDWMVGLFKRAGAKYFAPCAVHHDNFDLWDSRHHRFNAAKMGPKKDLIGMFREATLRAGLRFGVTTHLSRAYSWVNTNKNSDDGGAYDGNDPAWRGFYLPPSEDQSRRYPVNPPPQWRRAWVLRLKDLIDRYEPDHLYFDGGVPFRGDDRFRSGLEVLAHYYNRSIERHGKLDSVMFIKDTMHVENPMSHGLYVTGIASRDYERRRPDTIRTRAWQTDTSIGPWGYDTAKPYTTPTRVIHELIDMVSKNGNMLLNVPPKADGTLDDATINILEAIGAWLARNGEAIYGTRPWKKSGQGDVRYTTRGDTFYAILLAWPAGGAITLEDLGAAGLEKRITRIDLLGSDAKVDFTQHENGLAVRLPQTMPAEPDHAYVLKITPEASR